MSKKVSADEGIKNIGELIAFRKDNSNTSKKRVVVEMNGRTIFNDNVTVVIGDYNIYYRVDIIWDDVITQDEYHNLGLYGYYSSDYCEMDYSAGVLTIDTREGIVIQIF